MRYPLHHLWLPVDLPVDLPRTAPENYGFTSGRKWRMMNAKRAGVRTVNKSPVVKRSILVGGHKTSVSLEDAFWNGMKEISGQRSMTLSELVREIDTNRHQGNLSSAIRLFVLDHFRNRSAGFDRRVVPERAGAL
jgi:predicted DNA-binding ribbon-helix-helix protein